MITFLLFVWLGVVIGICKLLKWLFTDDDDTSMGRWDAQRRAWKDLYE